MHPTITFLVQRPEEGFSAIPTIGAIAGNYDAYRTVAVSHVRDMPRSWCFTDADAAAALGRVVDGPITSASDIDAAETALRALLLHEYVEVVVPCVKAAYEGAALTYIRPDTGIRKDAAFKAFESTPNRDMLMALEFVTVRSGQITESSKPHSALLGKPVEGIANIYRRLMQESAELVSALPMAVQGATAYSAPEFKEPMLKGAAGFVDEIYRRVYKPWMDVAQSGVQFGVDLKLPPLLAIVLSRAPTRERIPEVLRDLRAELANARAELNRLNDMLESTLSQADLHAQILRANESFDAIVPEALLTDSQRRARWFASVFHFIKPVAQLYSIATNPLLLNREEFAKAFESARQAVKRDRRIVARSVAATKLTELLRVESVRQIMQSQFATDEIDLIARGTQTR